MKNNLITCPSPHLHTRESVSKIMWAVALSLVPAGAAGVIIFGFSALWIIILGVISALISECLLQSLTKRKVTILDGSAFVTGLLLAYNLPPKAPFWLPILGSFFAIFIGKFVFGGLGQNIFNPALVGRVFLMASWPKYMTAFTPLEISSQSGIVKFLTGFTKPLSVDAVTSATPLSVIKEGKILENISYLDLFLGKRGGCIGEVCIFALLLGAAILLIKGYISWHTPLTYIATVGVFTYIFGPMVRLHSPLALSAVEVPKGLFSGDWLFHILSGGLILGAFFMATDYVTSPLTQKGQIIFGVGCGLLTGIIRLWGGYPEGASYAILIMNALVPLIDRHIRTRIYGTK